MPDFSLNNESALLLQVSEGSEAAFGRLFYAYKDKLYAFIFSISNSRQQSEDIVQEVFLKIWQKRSGLLYIREFDAYLFRMAHNHAISAFRRMARETLILAEKEQNPPASPGLTESLEYREVQMSMRAAIDKLPPKQKEVLLLSRDHGLKQAEISRILNITIPTVKSHMTQAMHSLRKHCKNIYPLVKIWFVINSIFIF